MHAAVKAKIPRLVFFYIFAVYIERVGAYPLNIIRGDVHAPPATNRRGQD